MAPTGLVGDPPGPLAPGDVVSSDGVVLPARAASKIESTDTVPTGTMITVPSVKPAGVVPMMVHDDAVSAPVVGVNTVNKWTDPQFLLNAFLGLGGVVVSVIQLLPASGPINWRVTGPAMFIAAYGALQTWLRNSTNTVTR